LAAIQIPLVRGIVKALIDEMTSRVRAHLDVLGRGGERASGANRAHESVHGLERGHSGQLHRTTRGTRYGPRYEQGRFDGMLNGPAQMLMGIPPLDSDATQVGGIEHTVAHVWIPSFRGLLF
jgi:hypothetical protein